jgi:hypothetical protein
MSIILSALLGLFLAVTAFAQAPPPRFSIEWDTNRSAVRVMGTISADLQNAAAEKLQELFPVSVEPANVLSAIVLPPIAGSYSGRSNAVEFQARFPFEPGVAYRASFLPAKVSSVLRMPQREQPRITVVAQIYPTADLVPQNLLKLYLHFSGPMSRGHIYEHIHLVDQEGRTVELPFLEINEELWNPEMTRLTLFLDPGRIKRGVRPLEEVGPALLPEKSYTLTIDDEWRDARGARLKEPFVKKFRVILPDREPPNPATWKISPPKAGSRDPVTIFFSEPMDEALALRMISVKSAAGTKSLAQNERLWRFNPEEPWKASRYEVLVQSTIEDLAGNNVGKPFEVDLQQNGQPRQPPKVISLFFQVQ